MPQPQAIGDQRPSPGLSRRYKAAGTMKVRDEPAIPPVRVRMIEKPFPFANPIATRISTMPVMNANRHRVTVTCDHVIKSSAFLSHHIRTKLLSNIIAISKKKYEVKKC